MQKSSNIILKAALAFVVIVSAAGCITEKFDTSDGLQSVMLQINVAAGEMTKSDPTDAESVINSVRIYAYRADGTQAGHFYRASSSAEPIIMDLVLPENGTHSVDFYVFANEASMNFLDDFAFEETMTKNQLSKAKFHAVSPQYGIPMYCVQNEYINVDDISPSANSVQGHEGHFLLRNSVDFGLIRPLAKLSVYSAIVEGGLPGSIVINDVEFTVNGTRQFNYLLPQLPEVLADVPVRSSGRYLITQDVTIRKTLDKTNEAAINNPDNYDLIVAGQYIGEVEVGDKNWQTKESDRQAILHVTYSVGSGSVNQHGIIYLPEIVRNTHYKVCIRINTEGQIMITYTVADWDDAEVSEYLFDYPTHTYLRVQPNETDTPAAPAEMSENVPFVGYFKMSYPGNEEWNPALLTNADKCEVTVYKNGESTPAKVPVATDPDNWYKIEVKQKEGADINAGDKVELAISYAPNYLDGVFDYLMINGSQGNYYWPYDDNASDPNKVIITVK